MPFIDDTPFNKGTVNEIAMNKSPFGAYVSQHSFASDISLDLHTRIVETDVACINQSISNILLTMPTERLFKLEFGTDLFKYLFENFTNVTGIKNEVMNQILKYEKRVRIDPADITVELEQTEYWIELGIKYYIIETKQYGSWNERLYV